MCKFHWCRVRRLEAFEFARNISITRIRLAEFTAWTSIGSSWFAKTWQNGRIFASCLLHGSGKFQQLCWSLNDSDWQRIIIFQRALDRHEKSTMGATAIIVCLTAQVPEIARMCRDLLQIHQFRSHVVEAVGQRDTVSVTVSASFSDFPNGFEWLDKIFARWNFTMAVTFWSQPHHVSKNCWQSRRTPSKVTNWSVSHLKIWIASWESMLIYAMTLSKSYVWRRVTCDKSSSHHAPGNRFWEYSWMNRSWPPIRCSSLETISRLHYGVAFHWNSFWANPSRSSPIWQVNNCVFFFSWNFVYYQLLTNNYCFQNKSKSCQFEQKELWSFVTSSKRLKLWLSIL